MKDCLKRLQNTLSWKMSICFIPPLICEGYILSFILLYDCMLIKEGARRGKKIGRYRERKKKRETYVTQEIMPLLRDGCMAEQRGLARKREGRGEKCSYHSAQKYQEHDRNRRLVLKSTCFAQSQEMILSYARSSSKLLYFIYILGDLWSLQLMQVDSNWLNSRLMSEDMSFWSVFICAKH